MARGSDTASTEWSHAQSSELQQALRQLVQETEADAAFLATSNAGSVGKAFSIVAWYPPDGRPDRKRALLKTRWIRRAVNGTLESGRTALTAGAWRVAAERQRRSELLIAASVFSSDDKDSAPRGAVAILLPSAEADLEVVARLERIARGTVGALMRSRLVPTPSPATVAPLFAAPERRDYVLLHELRVPLGAASFALEALAMRHDARWGREDERLIQTAQFGLMEAQGVLRLANQASQAQASGDLGAPSLRAVSLEMALERAQALFPEAGGRLRMDLYDNLPAVWADALWLTQALTNLLENALKHSWPGTPITVTARPQGSDRALISVQSFGEEFPADQRQIFVREARDVLPTSPPGNGLGLCIARHFIAGMGGEIWVDSGEHGATEVKVALPIALA